MINTQPLVKQQVGEVQDLGKTVLDSRRIPIKTGASLQEGGKKESERRQHRTKNRRKNAKRGARSWLVLLLGSQLRKRNILGVLKLAPQGRASPPHVLRWLR